MYKESGLENVKVAAEGIVIVPGNCALGFMEVTTGNEAVNWIPDDPDVGVKEKIVPDTIGAAVCDPQARASRESIRETYFPPEVALPMIDHAFPLYEIEFHVDDAYSESVLEYVLQVTRSVE